MIESLRFDCVSEGGDEEKGTEAVRPGAIYTGLLSEVVRSKVECVFPHFSRLE